MKLNFRKISAVLASGLMTVSGAAFAAAANFPAPFVVGGSADAAVVYGTGAGALDQTPANSIGNYLSSKVTTGASAPTGESVVLEKSSDKLNFGDGWDTFTGNVDEDDLPTILKDGTYVADDNDEFDYEQKIELGAPILQHFRDSDYESEQGLDDRTPVVGFKINDGDNVLNYTLDFISDAESDIVSGDLDDIEGSDLMLFGKKYYVSNLDNSTDGTYHAKMELLDSATTATVSQGETATVTSGGKSYEVSISWMDADEVVFNVGGTTTDKLQKGDSVKLSDGSYIGVRSVRKLAVAGEVGSAEFSIGSGKLEMTSGSDIKLNDDTIQGVKAYIYRTAGSSGTEKVDKIEIRWEADDELFLTPDSEIVMPGFGGLKLTMADLVRPTEEKIVVDSSSETIEITVPIKDGDATFNLLYAETTDGNITGIGKASDELLATSNTSNILVYEDKSSADYHEYFVASYAASNEAESYLLKVNTEEDSTAGRNETDVINVVTGETICEDRSSDNTDCSIGDVALTINAVNYSSTEKVVDIDGGSGVSFHEIYTNGGMKIYLPYLAAAAQLNANGAINFTNATTSFTGHDLDSFRLYFDGEDKDDAIGGGTEFYVTIDSAGTSGSKTLHVNDIDGTGTGGSNGLEVGSSSNNYEAYIVGSNNETAPRLMHYTGSDSSDYVEIFYPTGDSETYAQVYLTSESSSTSAAGQMVFKDSEKSSWESKNVVVVGGSCINSAAATLLGGALCEGAFTDATGASAGQYVVQSFDGAFSSGKIALLVAGYNAADTVAAASRLIEPGADVDTTAGTKYIGTVGATGSSTMSKVE